MPIEPRIVLHGGAGNITRANLSQEAYHAYRAALLRIVSGAYALLLASDGAGALDVATEAVAQLEDDALFNAGRGAVFTASGSHELEASVMVASACGEGGAGQYRKRGVGVMLVNRVKNPVKLAREMLVRGDEADGGGAGAHCQLSGETAHGLAEEWGLEMVRPGYYWTKMRWNQHRKGLGRNTDDETYRRKRREADGQRVEVEEHEDGGLTVQMRRDGDPSWDGLAYLPQGTVGCVVLDSKGTLCTATSTGGLTNKLRGRIGDTPTIGAGFFAESWIAEMAPWFREQAMLYRQPSAPPALDALQRGLGTLVGDCLPNLTLHLPLPRVAPAIRDDRTSNLGLSAKDPHHQPQVRSVAMSSTGNGDSFLRLCAVRTAAAMVRFGHARTSLAEAVSCMAGEGGMLQQSAGERFGKTGEGEGGIIGIELRHGKGEVVADFNCGGMFRAWIDGDQKAIMKVFKDDYVL